jgi:hypothetical protein
VAIALRRDVAVDGSVTRTVFTGHYRLSVSA